MDSYADFCPSIVTGVHHINNVTIVDVSEKPEKSSGEDNDSHTPPPNEITEDNNNTEAIVMTVEAVTIKEEESDDGLLVINFHFMQQDDKVQLLSKSGKVERNDILLDSGTSCSVFRDNNLLSNIRKRPNMLCALNNGGRQD